MPSPRGGRSAHLPRTGREALPSLSCWLERLSSRARPGADVQQATPTKGSGRAPTREPTRRSRDLDQIGRTPSRSSCSDHRPGCDTPSVRDIPMTCPRRMSLREKPHASSTTSSCLPISRSRQRNTKTTGALSGSVIIRRVGSTSPGSSSSRFGRAHLGHASG